MRRVRAVLLWFGFGSVVLSGSVVAWLGISWESDLDDEAAGGLIGCGHDSAVGADGGFGDGESEASAAGLAVAGLTDAEEGAEDIGESGVGDSGAVVAYAYDRLVVVVVVGGATSSEGIDLSEQGELTMVVSRVSDSAVATVTAEVEDNSTSLFVSSGIILGDDQVLPVNGTVLTATSATSLGLVASVAATIAAADTYALSLMTRVRRRR